MYLSRTGDPGDLLLLLVLTLLWTGGGVLLAGGLFQVRRRELWLLGSALGLLLFISIANLVARLVPAAIAPWVAAGAVGGFGAVVAVHSRWRPPRPRWGDLFLVAGVIAIFGVAASVNRGLAIFDDYHNLPLVSRMATGDIPPRFYLDPDHTLAYHYGLHVFASAIMQVGSLYPWSAFDLAKSLSLALALGLMFLWLRRTRSPTSTALAGTSLFAFLSGARWMLLLAPAAWAKAVAGRVALFGSATETAPTLFEGLSRTWQIDGAGTARIPFAYLSGIVRPAVLFLDSAGALMPVCVLVLLMLHRRRQGLLAGVLLAVVAGVLALVSEVTFLALLAGLITGIGLWVGIGRTAGWRRPPLGNLAILAGIALTLAVLQGGALTALASSAFGDGKCVAGAGHGCIGFSFFWPPAIISAHLGNLAVSRPAELLVALLEIGPVLLLAPLALVGVRRWLRHGNSLRGGLGVVSIAFALSSLMVRYAVERDTARLMGESVVLWIVLGLPMAAVVLRGASGRLTVIYQVGLALGMVGGLVTSAALLTASTTPSFTYFATDADERMARAHWNRLEEGALIFDSLPFRAVTVFGRPTRSNVSLYVRSADWERLFSGADLHRMAAAGFRYTYVDEGWWNALEPEQRSAFERGCAQLLGEEVGERGSFRRLYDLQDCR